MSIDLTEDQARAVAGALCPAVEASGEVLSALREMLEANSYYFPIGNPWGDKARIAIEKVAAVSCVNACMRSPTFEFDRYIGGTLMAEGVTIEREPNLGKAMARAAQIASRGPNGETPVLIYRPRPE